MFWLLYLLDRHFITCLFQTRQVNRPVGTCVCRGHVLQPNEVSVVSECRRSLALSA